jgi:hypothetical protein
VVIKWASMCCMVVGMGSELLFGWMVWRVADSSGGGRDTTLYTICESCIVSGIWLYQPLAPLHCCTRLVKRAVADKETPAVLTESRIAEMGRPIGKHPIGRRAAPRPPTISGFRLKQREALWQKRQYRRAPRMSKNIAIVQ